MELNETMYLANNAICSWLSENLDIDENKLLRSPNISIESIYSKASSDIPNVKEICNQNCIFKMLKAIFPCITKSKMKENGVFISSVKGVKFNLQPEPGENIRFADINKYVPQQWNVLENTTTTLTLGYLSIETFNGNSVLMKLKIGSDRLIGLFVAGKAINLSDFFIGKSITFTLKSLKGLFKSLRTVGLCYGATLETNDSDIFSSSKLCVKEICLTDTKSKTVIRHVECLRTVQINSHSHTCIKCSEHKRHKKYDQSKIKNSDKENVNPATQQKTDVTDQLRKIAPNLSENQILLITSQIESSSLTHSKGVRWPKEIICMALTIYNRNPSAYKDITRNGWLNLPSESLLYLYKNAVKQKPGIIPTMMEWMKNEAVRLRVETEGYYGGVLLDEMSIQEDLQIVNHGNGTSLFGLVDCEPEVMLMHCSNEGKCESKLANHVMQYIFHGITGFRWPFANYPNAQAAPADIFITTWKCIDALYEWGFKPIYLCMDGSSNNRAFLKMHFPENDPLLTKMVASHYKNPLRKMIFIMDPCHLIKKIRNSVLSSGIKAHDQRLLSFESCTIQWQMWIDAYNWDRNTHRFPIHNKLTQEHIFPNNAQKMRNKLAFETLNVDMLHLMKMYRKSLSGEAGQQALSAVIQFLEHSSTLVEFFTDQRPVKDMSDERIMKLSIAYNWYKSWEKQVCQNDTISRRYKSLLTMETREDLDFMYHGIMSLITFCIEVLKTEVVPARLNSDIIENIFCQQRSLYHGPTTHPTYNSYRTGINSVVLGQSLVSRKSNAGGNGAKPFSAEIPTKKLRI